MNDNGIEMLVVETARQIRAGETVFAGVGLPIMAMAIAKKFYHRDITILCESGIVDTMPTRLAMSIADPSLAENCVGIFSPNEIFSFFLQGGRIDVGVLGGAQIDRYGNVNSTVIGPYAQPKLRMPGSGGACEIASNAKSTIIVMPQSKRRFVDRVDFVTSPGHVTCPETRRNIRGGGPRAAVSDLGLYRFSEEDGEMVLAGLFGGVSLDDVREKTGWEMKCPETVARIEPPTAEEIEFIHSLDPQGIFLGKVG